MSTPAARDVAAVVIGASAGGVRGPGRAADRIAARLRSRRADRRAPAARTAEPARRTVCVALRGCRSAKPWTSRWWKPARCISRHPDYHLLVDGHEGATPTLALSVDAPVHYSRPSIDVLFESAAECWGGNLMGVILTGANEDGAQGLAAVARAGGITVVQEPAEAVAPMLPAAAVRTRTRTACAHAGGHPQAVWRTGWRAMNAARIDLPPVKFLLVDDLEDNLLALSALLRESHVEILLARSGAEALELLLVHDVALALLDVQMPEMDGFELAELMRGSERTRPCAHHLRYPRARVIRTGTSAVTTPVPWISSTSPSSRTSCAARPRCSTSCTGRSSSSTRTSRSSRRHCVSQRSVRRGAGPRPAQSAQCHRRLRAPAAQQPG